MRHLIDTQAVIWYVDRDHLLTPTAHAAITNLANDLLLQIASQSLSSFSSRRRRSKSR